MRLTIAIPFFQGVDYLRVAIDSVLAQRRSDWRLLVCDEGMSGHDIRALTSDYDDERIHYYENAECLGMAGNWNQCLERAETDYVTILHADDKLLPGYADLVIEMLDAHAQVAAACCDAQIIDAGGAAVFSAPDAMKRFFVPSRESQVLLRGEPGLRALMAGNFIICPTLCFRMSLIGSRRFSDRWQQVQDLDFTTSLLLEGETILLSRERAYAYRRHASGMTAVQSASMLRFEEEFRFFDLVAGKAELIGWHGAARVARGKRIVRLHLLYRFMREALAGRLSAAGAAIRMLFQRSG
jgi:glycosyltransferase involved in cell wall biosynthesis